MKANKFYLIFTIIIIQSCDCHYPNAQAYVKCLEDNVGNEKYCIEKRSKYSENTCKKIDYSSSSKN